jgi:hypothetical protein
MLDREAHLKEYFAQVLGFVMCKKKGSDIGGKKD